MSGEMSELVAVKVVRSSATDDGKWAVLWVEDANGDQVAVCIPVELSTSAAIAMLMASQSAREKAGIESRTVHDADGVSIELHPMDPSHRVVQSLLLSRSGTQLSIAYDLSEARKLHRQLADILHEADRRAGAMKH